MYKCKYCGREFETTQQLGGHVHLCKNNPDYDYNREACLASCHRANQAQIAYKQIIPRDLVCQRCGAHYTLVLSKYKFENGKYSKFCSRSCANSRGKYSEERKSKISQGLRRHWNEIEKQPRQPRQPLPPGTRGSKKVIKICEYCGKEFIVPTNRRSRKYCCKDCMEISRHNKLSESGKKSAFVQGEERRSKNEKLFCKLCEQQFQHVEHNQTIFNGWDADVLIYDLKIAVLWNGVWHYKKITKRHSVEQVQNRDRLKIKEIEQKGWIPYIIEDNGKYNPDFVKHEFEKFLASLKPDG